MPSDLDLTFIGVVYEGSVMEGKVKVGYLEGQHALPSNEPPTVAITTPVDGEQFSGVLMIEGTSSDDHDVVSVEYRIDGGVWKEVVGNATWTLELDTSTLDSGTHQLEVRAFDGEEWSTVTKAVFESDQPPEVEMTTQIGNLSLHGIWAFVGIASDDNEVDRVEFSVDDGSWFRAAGTSEWSFELDTSMFTSSDHVLKIRASDGERFSLELEFNFSINQLPIVSILGHVEGKLYKDNVEFEGTASDDTAVVSVEVRVDGGEWFDIGAEVSWKYKVDTDGLSKGNHSFDVRVWDGEKYSEVYSTYFSFEESESPGFGLLAALLATMVAVPLARRRMGRE
jgi:nuclear transport factor 2 (NTF2) superfamily protein